MMTLSRIAKLANVSVSTASKAFSGSREVNEETREMIFRVAREHHCFKQFFNAKYPRLVIAVICPEFESLYYTRYLSFIQKNLEEENCEICVASHRFSAETEEGLLEYYDRYAKVDGIIVVDSRAEEIGQLDLPVVFLHPSREHRGYPMVVSDREEAYLQGLDYLLEHKAESIGYLGERLTSSSLAAFRESLQKRGIIPEERYISVSEKRFEEGGYDAMEQLVQRDALPRAIFCAYDAMAIGAMKCIRDRGLSVPEDVAVLGMNDNPEAEYLNPPLASISAETEETCRIAAELLLKKINGEGVPERVQVASKLKLRESFQIREKK